MILVTLLDWLTNWIHDNQNLILVSIQLCADVLRIKIPNKNRLYTKEKKNILGFDPRFHISDPHFPSFVTPHLNNFNFSELQ